MSCILVADDILAHIARSATRLSPLAENLLPSARRVAAELRKANIEAYRERCRCSPPPECRDHVVFTAAAGIQVTLSHGVPVVDSDDVGRLYRLLDFYEYHAGAWSLWPTRAAHTIVEELRTRLDRSFASYQFGVLAHQHPRYLLPNEQLAHIAISFARLDAADIFAHPPGHQRPSVGKLSRILAVANARSLQACNSALHADHPPMTPHRLFGRRPAGIAVATSPEGPLCGVSEAGDLLSLLDFYTSQAAGGPGWPTSEAARIIQNTRKLVRSSIPGARFAQWGELVADQADEAYA